MRRLQPFLEHTLTLFFLFFGALPLLALVLRHVLAPELDELRAQTAALRQGQVAFDV